MNPTRTIHGLITLSLALPLLLVPFPTAVLLLLLLPPVALVAAWRFEKTVMVKNGRHLDYTLPFAIPSLALFIHLLDYTLADWGRFLVAGLTLACLLGLLAWLCLRHSRPAPSAVVMVAILCLCYGLGAACVLNVAPDRSPERVVHARIVARLTANSVRVAGPVEGVESATLSLPGAGFSGTSLPVAWRAGALGVRYFYPHGEP